MRRVELDDALGRAPLAREGGPQRAPGPAVAPEHVVRLLRERAAREEVRLERREALDPVDGVRAREPAGRVAPAEQAARDHREPLTCREQTMHEVEVLGPAALAVAEAAQRLAPHQPRRVRERTLDEGLAHDVLGALDRREPSLVAREAVAERAREEPHVAADAHEVAAARDRVELGTEPIAMHPVVGVHARHPGCATRGQAGLERGHEAASGPRDAAETRIVARERASDLAALVR